MNALLGYTQEALKNIDEQQSLKDEIKTFKETSVEYQKKVALIKETQEELKQLLATEMSTQQELLKSLGKELTQMITSASKSLEKDKKILRAFFSARAKGKVEDAVEKGEEFDILRAELE